MPLSRAFRCWIIYSAPMLLMLAVLFAVFQGHEAEVYSSFRQHVQEHPSLAAAFVLITDWGNPLLYVVYAVILGRGLLSGDRAAVRFVVVYVIVQLAIALVTVRFLKMSIGRPRPGEDPFPPGFTAKPSYHSLPSGHTTEVTGSTMALAMRWPRVALLLGLGCYAALVGFSRIYLGWHHPTDVLCGWLLGSVAGLAVTLFAPRSP